MAWGRKKKDKKEEITLMVDGRPDLNNPDLRRLSRAELLELLVEMSREKDELQKKLDEAEARLADRSIQMENAGSIAKAALDLNEIFSRAQQAADEYVESIKANAAQAGIAVRPDQEEAGTAEVDCKIPEEKPESAPEEESDQTADEEQPVTPTAGNLPKQNAGPGRTGRKSRRKKKRKR